MPRSKRRNSLALNSPIPRSRKEGTDLRLESRTSSHLVRIQGTQNPADVVQDIELIAVIANQQAADAVRKAADALANGADAEAAVQHFRERKTFFGLLR